MFEAVHGSAPRMITDGRGAYANPSSITKAAEMMLRHIGCTEQADKLSDAIDSALEVLNMTSNKDGNTADDFTKTVIEKIKSAAKSVKLP